MYRYDEFDRAFVTQRVAQFREQVARRIDGELTEDEFKPLRLTNGVYLQLHAYMLRVAIPYGTLSSRQLRWLRSEEHTSELQSLMRISYAVFCLKTKSKLNLCQCTYI